jgi:predicted RNA-binding Zn-ribbon protein involved in translation (DUF1610 family)
MKRDMPEIYECPYCDFQTTFYPTLLKHVKGKHNSTVCPVCGKRVQRRLLSHAYLCYRRNKTLPEEHFKLWLLLRRSQLRPARREFAVEGVE